MNTDFRTIVEALNARKSGANWMARCPAHDDSNPSLALREKDGKILITCHAGCEQPAVISALKARGLWPRRPKQAHGDDWSLRIVQTYDYCDEHGNLLYQTCRLEPKDFRQRRPDGYGGWINNLQTFAAFCTGCRK